MKPWKRRAAGLVGTMLFAAWCLAAQASEKKGLGVGRCMRTAAQVTAFAPAWYYDWTAAPVAGVRGPQFVPMVWGGQDHFTEALADLARAPRPHDLLAFNEPDGAHQSQMSVDQVVSLWPRIAPLADRIGSPAPGSAFGPWMQGFTAKAEAARLKVDFIALHWYGKPNPTRFLNWVDRAWVQYKKPLWITEFAVVDRQADQHGGDQYSSQTVVDFMKKVLPELDRRPFVERYAWFGSPCKAKVKRATSAFYGPDGVMTDVGRFYATYQ